MDPSVATQIVVLICLLILSAFFSSSETALTTVNKVRMRCLADLKDKRAIKVCRLIDDPSRMLSAILIGNNVVNLTASSITTSLALKLFDGNYAVGIATFILTLVILIFGEITPKTLATIHSERLSLMFAGIILPVTIVFTPIVICINKLSRFFLKLIRVNPDQKEQAITENELLSILDVSHEEGVIEAEEHQMISNVVDFGDSLAKDVMVPRIDMASVDVNATYDELLQVFEEDMYSRLPVYEDSRDNVIGIISLKDVFFYKGNKKDFKISDFLREPYFTYETKKTSELLQELRKSTNSIAIVLDEYGATAGLLTIEDLVEEIIGEIRDEYDGDELDDIRKTGDNEYTIEGNAKIDELNELLELGIETEDYDSIAGHVIHLLDRLPNVGDVAVDGPYTYKVIKMDKKRIEEVLLTIDEDAVNAQDPSAFP